MKNFNSFNLNEETKENLNKEDLYFKVKLKISETNALIKAANTLMDSGFSQEDAFNLVGITLEDYYTFDIQNYQKNLIEKVNKENYDNLIEHTLNYFDTIALLKKTTIFA